MHPPRSYGASHPSAAHTVYEGSRHKRDETANVARIDETRSVPSVGAPILWVNTLAVTATPGRSCATCLMMAISLLALPALSPTKRSPDADFLAPSIVMGVSFPWHPSIPYSFNRVLACFGSRSHLIPRAPLLSTRFKHAPV